jgi:nucleotide sugar dehydrogenase
MSPNISTKGLKNLTIMIDKHKIGIVGLGKLGQSLYDVISDTTDMEVVYYDIISQDQKYKYEPIESIKETCTLIFICVSTPENPLYDGSDLFYLHDLKEFDYDYTAVHDTLIDLDGCRGAIIISSTISPKGIDDIILNTGNLRIIYNPFMFEGGNEYNSILNQKNIIIGSNRDPQILIDFYRNISPDAAIHTLSFTESALLKMIHNSYVSLRISFVNAVQRLTYEVGGEAQNILNALKEFPIFNTPRFLNIGLPSGGPCIPRDSLVLSRITKEGLFDDIVSERMIHIDWLSDNIIDLMTIYGKTTISLFGLSYKKGVKSLKGSSAVLLKKSLENKDIKCYVDRETVNSFNVLLNEDSTLLENKSLYYDIWRDRVIVKE